MIVRILNEGQYEVPDAERDRLDAYDAAIDHAVSARDEEGFSEALKGLIAAVHELGTPLDASRLVPSDLAVPAPGSSLEEVLKLLEAPADS